MCDQKPTPTLLNELDIVIKLAICIIIDNSLQLIIAYMLGHECSLIWYEICILIFHQFSSLKFHHQHQQPQQAYHHFTYQILSDRHTLRVCKLILRHTI